MVVDPQSCPVQLFKLYLSKLNPKIKDLWQKPRIRVNYVDEEWYEPRHLRRDHLERFMKLSLAESVKLSQEYTNHSIRATVISSLDAAGFKGRHIIQISSHKSETSIKEYSTKCPENKKREMYESLSVAIAPKSKKIKAQNATVSANPQVEDVKLDLASFDLEPFDTIDDELLAKTSVRRGTKDRQN